MYFGNSSEVAFLAAEMFERFSPASIEVLTTAQQLARELQLAAVDEVLIIYGIIVKKQDRASQILDEVGIAADRMRWHLNNRKEKGSDIIPIEIPFTESCRQRLEKATDLCERSSGSVEPVHLLFHLRFASGFEEALKALGLDALAIDARINHILQSEPALSTHFSNPVIQAVKPIKSPPRSMRDWFSDDAIEAVTAAEEYTRANGRSVVSVEDLLQGLLSACPWIPVQARADLAVQANELDDSFAEAVLETEFSRDVLTIFLNARTEASARYSDRVRAEHLLLALLNAVSRGNAVCALADPNRLQQACDLIKAQVAGK